MVSPLLFAMMLGIIEYGFVFFGYSAMQSGANNVARSIAVNRLDINQASAAVDAYLPTWMNGAVVTAQRSNVADPTKSFVQLRIVATAASTGPISIFTAAFPMTLTADAAVRQELPFAN